jgi:hypothetical protein
LDIRGARDRQRVSNRGANLIKVQYIYAQIAKQKALGLSIYTQKKMKDRREKQDFSWDGCQGKGDVYEERGKEGEYGGCILDSYPKIEE